MTENTDGNEPQTLDNTMTGRQEINTQNSRNGCNRKTINTELSPVEVSMPRDRSGELEPEILPKDRLGISEHPFETMKWHHGAHYFLCKGIEKTSAEIALSYMAYNLTRALNKIGVSGFLRHFRKKRS